VTATQTYVLGAIAGLTIFLGLPIGRIRHTRTGPRAGLAALATGILIFLFWDVTTNGVEPVESALDADHWSTFAARAFLLALGFALGLMTLVYYDRWLKRRRETKFVGPGAASVEEFQPSAVGRLSPADRLALLIATGIGIHNFAEGLAIGQSAASGEIALALVLIIGFGLHNTTEGFGIVGPLSAEPALPSWRFLVLLGVIGGGPTFLGTVIGYSWVSVALEVLFFALAAGSILFVVLELVSVCRRYAMPVLVGWMMLLGVALGFATDFVLTALGA
jgi:ZIP family zinc transporter